MSKNMCVLSRENSLLSRYQYVKFSENMQIDKKRLKLIINMNKKDKKRLKMIIDI